ncbi:TetR/AcrR family transcriptional regulator [Microbacterium aoyamense]|uniref:TetR/AcrR family transcriptional regulator n=1 Tax=Microbacterium aoyamense TaxID=344166 RepID=A0ABP5BA46_9MICO|nr:TetR/AcrR family transcriptional regulator [Microbacterium aoyamense]
MTAAAPPRRTGPVRSEGVRLAILEATARQFAARGYDHLTIEGIAAEAAVGKQTIYRWWGSKSALVAECLVEGMLLPHRLAPPDTGDIRADLTAWVDAVLTLLAEPQGETLLRSIIAAAAENADIGRRIRESLAGSESIVGRLEASIGTAPNLTPGAPFEELSETLVGAIVLRALSRAPREPGDAARIVAAVLGPA